MADFFVAFLVTLVILFLSLLFWKWINRRNQLITEEHTRMRISKTEVRNNRLRKFDKTPIENRANLTDDKLSKLTETSTEKSDILLAKDPPVTDKETPLNATKQTTLQHDATSDVASTSGLDVFGKTSTNETVVSASPNGIKSPPKPANSQKWVSFWEVTEISLPQTRPLTNLDELRTWNEGFDEFNVSNTALRRASDKLEARPRTLVCHDMKGGYLEDR